MNLNNLQYKYKYEFCLTFTIGGTAYNYEEKNSKDLISSQQDVDLVFKGLKCKEQSKFKKEEPGPM